MNYEPMKYQKLAMDLKQLWGGDKPVLVGIDGPGASGKSTIAKGLMAACGSAEIVHVDDFYQPSDSRYDGQVDSRPIGAAFDLARLREEVLEPLKAGTIARYRRYNWDKDQVDSERIVVRAEIVLVEGIYSLSTLLTSYFDFAIWVECPSELRLRRGLERDGEAARSLWVDDWMPGEDKYIEGQKPSSRADLICDGSQPGSMDICMAICNVKDLV